MPVGTDTVRSASVLNVFKKAPVKAELAMEVTMPAAGGRKMRAFYGREADGSWRGQVEDIGHLYENSPYAYIRVLDDEVVGLRDVHEITGDMSDRYEAAIERDHQDWDDADLYKKLDSRMQELKYNLDEMRKDLEAGFKLFFGDQWESVAKELFPAGRPRI